MNWGVWQGWTAALSRFGELEILARARSRISRRDPDKDLTDVELSDRERRDALEREITRRSSEE